MRILIIAASAGAGHVRAGQALEASVRILKPEADVRRVDILDFTAKTYKKTYAGGYIKFSNFESATRGDDLKFFVISVFGMLGLTACSVRNIMSGRRHV